MNESLDMSRIRFLLAILIAMFLDVADILFFAWLPLVGDVLDVIGVGMLLVLMGPYALIGALELVPFLDFLPLHMAAVVFARAQQKRRIN